MFAKPLSLLRQRQDSLPQDLQVRKVCTKNGPEKICTKLLYTTSFSVQKSVQTFVQKFNLYKKICTRLLYKKLDLYNKKLYKKKLLVHRGTLSHSSLQKRWSLLKHPQDAREAAAIRKIISEASWSGLKQRISGLAIEALFKPNTPASNT
jgi:hypothetical protein